MEYQIKLQRFKNEDSHIFVEHRQNKKKDWVLVENFYPTSLDQAIEAINFWAEEAENSRVVQEYVWRYNPKTKKLFQKP